MTRTDRPSGLLLGLPVPVLVVRPGNNVAVAVSSEWLRLARTDLTAELQAGWLFQIAAADRPAVLRLLSTAGTSRVAEVRMRDGRWLELRAGPAGPPYDGMTAVVAIDITPHKAAEARLEHEAMHDSLTGLLARRVFVEELDRVLARRRADRGVGVLFVDLDDFKSVNDRFGHSFGDLVLARQASRMTECLRPADALARIGGDEFAVLCDDVASLDEVTTVATRLTGLVEYPILVGNLQITVGASIGVAMAADGDTAVTLLQRADDAMYAAKWSGQGRRIPEARRLPRPAKPGLRQPSPDGVVLP